MPGIRWNTMCLYTLLSVHMFVQYKWSTMRQQQRPCDSVDCKHTQLQLNATIINHRSSPMVSAAGYFNHCCALSTSHAFMCSTSPIRTFPSPPPYSNGM